MSLRQLAADQFLRSGYIDAGTTAMAPILEAKGLAMPKTPMAALLALIRGRVLLGLSRPLRGFRERSPEDIPKKTLERIDLCWSATVGFLAVDQIRGVYFQTTHLRLALAAGEPFRIACGLAMEAIGAAAVGGATQKHLERAKDLAERFKTALRAWYGKGS